MHPSVENLATVWRSLDDLLASLDDADWARPTGCPGWSVQDVVSHLIDYEALAVEGRGITAVVVDRSAERPAHVRNDLGAQNEAGVEARRGATPGAVLAELRSVTTARLAQLGALRDEDLSVEIDLPTGRGSVADMLTLRVMDTWAHEQDVRRAVGRPGHDRGPAVDEAVGYLCRFVPVVVARRAGVPDGSTVVFAIEGRSPFTVAVEGGRGRQVDGAADDPTAALAMTAATFGALVGGRADVGPDEVMVTGDTGVAERVIPALAFLP